MPTYQYVNNSGGMSTINANTANEALANAQDKEPSSGVGLISTPQGASTTPTPPQSGVITPASLQNNQTPIQVPQPNPSVPPTPSTQPTLAQNLLGSFDLTANEQAATNTQENLLAKMLDNINNLAGESAFRTQVTNESGLGQKKLELQNLNSQILQKQAEIQQSDIQLVANMRAEERRDTLLPFAQAGQAKLAGDAQIARALKMSEIGVLNAQVLAGQGNIELAQKTIDEAVAAKFAPYKEQNAVYEAQLKAIQPFLDKAEKKEAAAQKLKTDLSLRKLDKLESDEKLTQKLAIEAGQNGAPKSLIDQALKARPEEAARLLSKYSTDNINYQRKLATAAGTFGVNPKVLNTTQFKAAQNAQQFKTVLKDTIGLVKKYGNYEKLNAAGKGALDAASVQLRSLLSTALEQGVVQPGEAPAFEKALGSLQSGIFKRNKVTIGSLESALRTAELKYDSQASALEGAYGVSRDALDVLTGDVNLPDQEYDDMDALIN